MRDAVNIRQARDSHSSGIARPGRARIASLRGRKRRGWYGNRPARTDTSHPQGRERLGAGVSRSSPRPLRPDPGPMSSGNRTLLRQHPNCKRHPTECVEPRWVASIQRELVCQGLDGFCRKWSRCYSTHDTPPQHDLRRGPVAPGPGGPSLYPGSSKSDLMGTWRTRAISRRSRGYATIRPASTWRIKLGSTRTCRPNSAWETLRASRASRTRLPSVSNSVTAPSLRPHGR